MITLVVSWVKIIYRGFVFALLCLLLEVNLVIIGICLDLSGRNETHMIILSKVIVVVYSIIYLDIYLWKYQLNSQYFS